MPVALYVNGGRFEVAEKYSADVLARMVSSPTSEMITLELAHGGSVRFGITPGLAWAVEQMP